MQERMEELQEELNAREYEIKAGGGAVKVTVTGKMEVKSMEIAQDVVDPDDVEMLSDLVMAAVNEALRAASTDKEKTMESLSGGFGGMNIPGLF